MRLHDTTHRGSHMPSRKFSRWRRRYGRVPAHGGLLQVRMIEAANTVTGSAGTRKSTADDGTQTWSPIT